MKKLLLVGAGHAHLYFLKQLQKTHLPDVEITLLTPSRYQYYSGMFSGYAEGLYTIDEIRIDVKKLADKSGVDWMKEAVMSVDPEQKMILTEQGNLKRFDIVSFDMGSLTAATDTPGVFEYAKVIKPNYRFPEMIDYTRSSPRLVVVGGGDAGVEMALSLHTRRMIEDQSFSTVLVSAHDILKQRGKKATHQAEILLSKRGVNVLKNAFVKKVMKDKLVTESGQHFPFDALLWLAGPKPPKLFEKAGLPVDGKGYLLIEDTLQVKQYPAIFAAGDCASLSSYPDMEKSGVHAVRQAPVLWANIKGFLNNGKGMTYTPPSSTLSILSTGNKTGMFLYKGRALHGKWAWKLKNRIDRRFIKRYQ